VRDSSIGLGCTITGSEMKPHKQSYPVLAHNPTPSKPPTAHPQSVQERPFAELTPPQTRVDDRSRECWLHCRPEARQALVYRVVWLLLGIAHSIGDSVVCPGALVNCEVEASEQDPSLRGSKHQLGHSSRNLHPSCCFAARAVVDIGRDAPRSPFGDV